MGGSFTNLLNKDVKEIKKIYLSLISVGIICLGVFLGVNITKSSYALFSTRIKGEKTIEVEVDTLINKTTVFNYTGTSQEYEVPKDGYYYLELAGASGGSPEGASLSYGAKVSGYIYLEKGETLYFYVGKQGTNSNTNCRTSGYEFNGGGIAKPAKTGVCGFSGGGATDIRLVGGSWDDINSLISRIMVAGAGGGSTDGTMYTLGAGGTLYGRKPIYSIYQQYLGNPGMQASGGAAPTKYSGAQSNGTVGSFGKGGYGGVSSSTTTNGGGSGGGAGYYGGSGASGLSNGAWPGGGGSSYISGYAGVNSIEKNTTITHTNNTLHYSGKYFIGGKMLEGQNKGNGYAKITYIGEKPEKKTDKLNNVRYIKNCISYNTYNEINHWIELQAIKDGINIAKGKEVTGTMPESTNKFYSLITDGDISFDNYSQAAQHTKNQCITVDLEKEYDLDEIAVWNYFGDQRTYYDNITSVSSDNNIWTEVIDEASIEESNGHRINAYTDTYNGYIRDNLILWLDGYANTGATHSYSSSTWKDLSGTGNNFTVDAADYYESYYLTSSNASLNSQINFNNTLSNTKDWTISVRFSVKQLPKTETTVGNTGTVFGAAYYNGAGIFWQRPETSDLYTLQVGKRSNVYHIKEISDNPVGTGVKHNLSIVHDYSQKTITVYDNNNKIYQDTLLDNETYSYLTEIGNIGINKNQTIGGNYTRSYANLRIFKVQIYSKALTEAEILHNYNYDREKFSINTNY